MKVLTLDDLKFNWGYFKVVGSRTGRETRFIGFTVYKCSPLPSSNICLTLDDRGTPFVGTVGEHEATWGSFFYQEVPQREIKEYLKLHKRIVGY